MEFITDITIIIDEAGFKDSGKLKKCLKSFSTEKKGSSYKVTGTYEELESLSAHLFAVKHHSCPATRAQIFQQEEKASTQVESVDVSAAVMAYIEQKRAKELNKIGANAFFIETQPDLRTMRNKPNSTVQVTFKPRHVPINPVAADFVKQRFVTFYQRTASDLQITPLSVSPHDHQDLQRRFPHLCLKPSRNKHKVTVTGPFVDVAKLKEFLSQNKSSSRKYGMDKDPAETAGRGTSVPSATHSKDSNDESCPICLEPIAISEKVTLDCKHSFCRSCLKKAFSYKPICATCGKVYGILTGTQPNGGKMNTSRMSSSLPGYEEYGTIIIHYYIPSGIQKVFKAMQRQSFQYDTFRRHARAFIEPAVIHRWKTSQDVMLQRLSQDNYDIWHMAKGISKKLETLSKLKEFEKLQKWMRSINNLIYWTAATSTTGPERVAKWTSILNHVQDIHTHEDPLYPVSLHESRRTRTKTDGFQQEEHPNPGLPYEGVSRTAYLPDSSEGRRILRLLKRAFDQRLIFTVGQSTTTGRKNTVTWNDIHHKTSTYGGPTNYGYPDPDYLRRVGDELTSKGIK